MYIVPRQGLMSDTGIAKVFMHGRSQAVHLPLAFRLRARSRLAGLVSRALTKGGGPRLSTEGMCN
jgi:hypothetical protein